MTHGECPNDAAMSYPRVCAHQGFNTIAPANSLPAYGAAVALGAQEIEFDLWPTQDGEIVSVHDETLERLSDGEGLVTAHTLAELQRLDFGFRFGEPFRGLRVPTLEDILRAFARRTVMNIHIKTASETCAYDPAALARILGLLDKYECREYVYFMCSNDSFLRLARETAPDICLCHGAGDDPWHIVENAVATGCRKVQLFKPYFTQETVDRAHANGLLCNVFWSDDAEEARRFLDMGIDTVLTNDFFRVSQALVR